MASNRPPQTTSASDPTLAQASPAGWRARVTALAASGKERLAALGLVLALGFAAGALALIFFAALADDVSEGQTQQLDTAVLIWLRQFQSPTVDALAQFCSAMGSEILAAIGVVLLVVLVVTRRWGAAVALFITTLGAQLLNDVLKDVFHRTRPAPIAGIIPAQSFSFPSGHAMVAAAFYGYLAYLAWRLLGGWVRWLAVSALLILVFLIGLSRLYLGVHYLTDVVAGYIAGFLWVDAVILGGHLLSRRRRPAPSPPPPDASAPSTAPPPPGSSSLPWSPDAVPGQPPALTPRR